MKTYQNGRAGDVPVAITGNDSKSKVQQPSLSGTPCPRPTVAFVQAFAGGALLTMLADTMMPEAFRFIFWAWLLGGPGAFLALPLTLFVAVMLETFPETRWIAGIMGLPTGAADAPPDGD